MAPVKPMGMSTPKSKPGVTGFVQEYNDQPSPSQDLNPDAVTDPDSLPEPIKTPKAKAARKSRRG